MLPKILINKISGYACKGFCFKENQVLKKNRFGFEEKLFG